MDFVGLILTIAFAGLVVWAVTTLVPMPAQFKQAIYVVSGLALLLYILNAFGVIAHVGLH